MQITPPCSRAERLKTTDPAEVGVSNIYTNVYVVRATEFDLRFVPVKAE